MTAKNDGLPHGYITHAIKVRFSGLMPSALVADVRLLFNFPECVIMTNACSAGLQETGN